MGKYIISTLFAFLFTMISTTAQAEDEAFTISMDDLVDEVRSDYTRKTGYWTEARFFEIGLVTNYQFALAKPDALDVGHATSTAIDTRFCWSYMSGPVTGLFGPDLRMGWYFAHGFDNVADKDVSAHSFLLQPGFFHANYVANRWLITETVSMPMVMFDPGIQVNINASYMITDWFAIKFGVSAGYYQTNLKMSDGEEADWFSLGPNFGLVFEPWGEYL